MSLRVYHADANPRVDSFSFRQSNSRAKELVDSGQGKYITLSDGRQAVQLFRRRADREEWIEQLERLTTGTSSEGGSAGMPFLKVKWPESVKALRLQSQIPNVRAKMRIPAQDAPALASTQAERDAFARRSLLPLVSESKELGQNSISL